MDNYSFGLVMTVVGMAGTMLSLWLLTLFMKLLKMALPIKDQDAPADQSAQGKA